MEVRFPVVWVAQTRFDYDTATPAQRKAWNSDACDQMIKAAPMYTSCTLYYNRHQISYVKLTTKFSGAGERWGGRAGGRSAAWSPRYTVYHTSTRAVVEVATVAKRASETSRSPGPGPCLGRCGSGGHKRQRYPASQLGDRLKGKP